MSQAEYRAEIDAEGLPPAAEVRPGVWVLPQPMPSKHSPRYTLSYLIQDASHGIHLVDPGWDDDANLDRLDDTLAEAFGADRTRLASIVATHLHADHLGLAERLQREHDVP
ncbi:MAG: MBL fold metallo-hydrolase, partial [Herbiconiux sp.]|nr:MBL fold metallo-hydrolase [Herbiconiux sp.]